MIGYDCILDATSVNPDDEAAWFALAGRQLDTRKRVRRT
jgi:hypothetical protein